MLSEPVIKRMLSASLRLKSFASWSCCASVTPGYPFQFSDSVVWSLHVCALPEDRLRRLHVLKYTTQLSCVR